MKAVAMVNTIIICKIFYSAMILFLSLSCHQSGTLKTDLHTKTLTANNNLSIFEKNLPLNSQFDGGVHGCGNFFLYKTTKDETKVVSVKVNQTALKINDSPQSFQIEGNKYFDVYIDDFGKDDYKYRPGYCFDVITADKTESIRYPAVKGKATFYTSKSAESHFYNAAVILENITFQTPDNNYFNIEKIEIRDVKVGWLPG